MLDGRDIIENFFVIPDKEGRDVPFIFNSVQDRIYNRSGRRNIYLKARQLGVSTFVVAIVLCRCLSQRNRRAVLISESTTKTIKLIDKVKYILDHLRGGLSADLRYNSRSELYFNKTDSVLYMGTAGSENVGVGDTITDLHCSEVALWADPIPLLKGLFNCVPATGTIWLESTGNGMGNYYHQQCLRALKGESQYHLEFIDWTSMPEYAVHMDEAEKAAFAAGLDEELDEPNLYTSRLLSLEQLLWRRRKINDDLGGDLQLFKEQYPLTFDECFQGSGASYFKRVLYVELGGWLASGRWKHFKVLGDHPKQGQTYVAGVDVGGGVGRDSTVLEIFSVDDMCQVGEWTNNMLEPHLAARAHAPILEAFNKCYVNPERNNHGILYIKELLDSPEFQRGGFTVHMSRPPKQVQLTYGKIADYGTFTSQKNRIEVIDALRVMSSEDMEIHSPVLKSEMDSFIEKDNGRLEAQEGCFDDHVMAAGHALFVYPKVAIAAGKWTPPSDVVATDPFSLDYMLQELERKFRENESPFS